MTTSRRSASNPGIEGQMLLIVGGFGDCNPIRPHTATEDPVDHLPPIDQEASLRDRNRHLSESLHFFNRSQKGAGIARAQASHAALDAVENGYVKGVAGVQERHILNLDISRTNFEKACRVCPFAGECALRGRFGKFVGPDNLADSKERKKFEIILRQDPGQQCLESLDRIKSRRRKAD